MSKKYGYVCYDSDYFGDDLYFIVRCRDNVTLGDVLRAIKNSSEDDVFRVLSSLGTKCQRGNDTFCAIAECQRGNVKYWLNVFQSDDGVSISLGEKEPDICHDDVATDLQEFSDYLNGVNVNVAPAFSDTDGLPF